MKFDVKVVAKFEATIQVEASCIGEAIEIAGESFNPVLDTSGIDVTKDTILNYEAPINPVDKYAVKAKELCGQ